jgi:hypothetical protein
MSPSAWRRRWLPYIVVRQEVWKTTWAFRVVAIGLLYLITQVTSPIWTRAVAESLVCPAEDVAHVDAVLIDDLEATNYLVFERARILREAGVTSRVLVPVDVTADGTRSTVEAAFVQTLARLSRVGDIETVPVAKAEPISLNVALDVRRFLTHNGIKSVAVVPQALRSERSMLIYRAVLEPAGVATYCQPAWGTRTPVNWIRTWHGVQDVALQFLKLQYYRFYVLPWHVGRIERL